MKSLHFIFMFIVVLVAIWWFFFQKVPVTNYPSDGQTIVAFGDSLIAGVGAPPGRGFVGQLELAIDKPISNLGVPGDTSADGLARLDQVLELNPKVVLVLLGGNDVLQKIPRSETQANLSRIIETLHDSGAVVVLLGVQGGLLSDSYKDMYKNLAKEHRTAYVDDVLSGVFARPNLMADPVHPNEMGYEKITERVLPVVESVL